MKINSIIFMLILSLLVISYLPVFAQSPSSTSVPSIPITVMTDKSSYSDGDTMIISGLVKDQLNVPISIVIKDTNQNIVLIGQVSANSDNTYLTQVTTGGILWSAVGTYEIDVTYGSKDRTAKATFVFTGYHFYPIIIQGVSYNVTYTITNGTINSITPKTDAKLLQISIDPAGDGTLVITLPRSLIDSKTGNQDDPFSLQEDGVVVKFEESKSDISRTLTLPFSSDTRQIEIIGTQIVPEFGPLVFVSLTISMMLILLYAKRQLSLYN
ncbi:MAG: copper-binding protein [Thaumarchaeota archaeon]|nr:MAG: copper-binding protein [Nitrososphaerota archaeon]